MSAASQSDRTTETYDRIADTYKKANKNRALLRPRIKQFAKHLPKNSRVLDIGCGPAIDTPLLQQAGLRVTAIDLSWGMLAAGRNQCDAPLVQADMRHLPFAKGWDGIWASASLLHLTHDDAVATIARFSELIRPKGILFLAVKQGQGTEWTQKSYGHAEPRFFSYWDSAELDQTLTKNSFTILKSKTQSNFKRKAAATTWLIRLAQRN